MGCYFSSLELLIKEKDYELDNLNEKNESLKGKIIISNNSKNKLMKMEEIKIYDFKTNSNLKILKNKYKSKTFYKPISTISILSKEKFDQLFDESDFKPFNKRKNYQNKYSNLKANNFSSTINSTEEFFYIKN